MSDDIILANDTIDDDRVFQIIPWNAKLYKRVTDIHLNVLYECNETNKNCTIPFDMFVFSPKFYGFILDHQNSESPLHKMEGKYLKEDIIFFPKDLGKITYKWRNIKYNPEAGLQKLWNNLRGVDDEKQKYIGLRAIDYKFMSYKSLIENNKYAPIIDINGTRYKVLSLIDFEINFDHYNEYIRTKKSFLDLLSNVFSLGLGVFNALSTFLTIFYSSNFDNYKIIEKILSDKKPEKKEKPKKIELTNISNKTDPLIQEKEEEKEIINTNNKEEEKFEEENQKYNIEDNEEDNEKDNNIQKRNLPKLRFIDFIFNNVYSSKRCKNNRQEIISICNELISKYNSIENTLYFQLKLENLLKDYKWNNPELGKLDNNQLIIQLKNLVSIYDDN